MSEIEKMYRRCKIKKRQTCRSSDTCYNGSLNACEGCNSYQYPPFTAEKQLELIKKLGNINIDIDNGCYMSSEILGVESHCDEFEETLAEFVNNLWQALTESEQEQIADILRG